MPRNFLHDPQVLWRSLYASMRPRHACLGISLAWLHTAAKKRSFNEAEARMPRNLDALGLLV